MKSLALVFTLPVLASSFLAGQDKPLGTMTTRWAAEVSQEAPRPEYPRPQLVRANWSNLNGKWEYAITAKDAPRPERWDGQILVPFCVESQLSGVQKVVGANQRLWYRTTFSYPELEAGRRLKLNFEAVDWHAEVFVNGKSVGDHEGGYVPFSIDLTGALTDAAEQEIVLSVWDPTDAGSQPRGKQVNEPRGIWYTAVTGIWGTVWLEDVSETHIVRVEAVGDPASGEGEIKIRTSQPLPAGTRLVYHFDGQGQSYSREVEAQDRALYTLPFELSKPVGWSPANPHLYGFGIKIMRGDRLLDGVTSYLALRTVGWEADKHGVNRLVLNGEPIFHYGPLDQGWWPDGLYTAPTDEALKFDIEQTKAMGFNMARKHVKVEPRRWYYWADKLGLMVWQDMPSGFARGANQNVGRGGPDDAVFSDELAESFLGEWEAIMDEFGVYPSIVAWIPFNEGWGQHRTNEILKWTKQRDPSRIVGGPSGWEDRGFGDMKDMHKYPGPGMFPIMPDRVSVLGEFGGLGLPVEGHLWWNKRNWGYRTYTSKEELHRNYENLITQLDALIPEGVAAAVYTQTTDVEGEVNGLMTYDRLPKFEAKWMQAQHAKLYEPAGRVVRTGLVPTAEGGAQEWLYTTERPAAGWEKPGFETREWKRGPGGFGRRDTPGTVVRTEWSGSDVWIRREFPVQGDKIPAGTLVLRAHHDEDAVVYLNGIEIAKLAGFTTSYTDFPLGEAARKALRSGKNLLAIHCHQTQGGQYIDAGLAIMTETRELAPAKRNGADHRVLLQGNGKLAVIEGGRITWEMPWGGIHDLHVLPNGHIMTQRNMREIVEIDPRTKKVVWSYDCASANGNSVSNSVLLDLVGKTTR